MPKTQAAASTAVGTAAPASGKAIRKPRPMPTTVPRTRRKPRTSVSPREVVLTKTHQVAPTAQYQRWSDTSWPTTSAKPAPAVAWTAWRVVMRASPVPAGGAGAAGGGRRRS